MPISAPIPPRVHLVCRLCGRRGSYSRARYIELAGTDEGVVALSNFAKLVAKCPRALDADPLIDERCRLRHDLAAEGRAYRGGETQKDPPPE